MRTRAREQAMATIATGAAVLAGITANLVDGIEPLSIVMIGIAVLLVPALFRVPKNALAIAAGE